MIKMFHVVSLFHTKIKIYLTLIEVVRSILAPNRFLLYRLFETNSFPQYFIEQYEPNKLSLDFHHNIIVSIRKTPTYSS